MEGFEMLRFLTASLGTSRMTEHEAMILVKSQPVPLRHTFAFAASFLFFPDSCFPGIALKPWHRSLVSGSIF